MSRRRPRTAVVVLVGVVGAAVAILITAGLQDTVVYYRTPTELGQSSAYVGHTARIGGQVLPGSLHSVGGGVEFRLGDGRSAVAVVAPVALPDTFREGQGAVVEGVLQPDGTFRADTVAVKHSNEYHAPPVNSATGAAQ